MSDSLKYWALTLHLRPHQITPRHRAVFLAEDYDALAARLAEAERDAQCYHHLCGLIRANPNAAAGEVLDWFTGMDRTADSATDRENERE